MNSTVISEFIASNFFYVFLGVIAITIFQRRYGPASMKKRFATIIQAVAIFIVGSVAGAIVEFGGTDLYLILTVLVVGLVLAFPLRSRAFPYRMTCPNCDTKLDMKTIYFRDDHLCEECAPKEES